MKFALSKADIIFEDNHLIAINKPSGVLVQGDKSGDWSLCDALNVFLRDKYEKPGDAFVGCIHRLDRPVTGLVLFAKTSKALARMNALFESRDVSKQYFAMVKGRPEKLEDTLVHFLIKDAAKNRVAVYNKEQKGTKRAELQYKVYQVLGGYSVLEVMPKTGRPHQIRGQLAKIECPIVGDLKYGYPTANPDQSICLHAHSLTFIHPVSNESIYIKAPLPTNGLWRNFKL